MIEGRFEGNVLVGRMKLCQVGPGCSARSFPFLGFYDPLENALSGQVRVDPGCQSPGLKDRSFVLQFQPQEAGERPGSASQLAARKLTRKQAEQAARAFAQARRHLDRGDYQKAVEQYETGLSHHEANYAAYIQLGVARMKLNNPVGAIDAYRKAELWADKPEPIIYYNLACAHARLNDRERTLELLRRAVRLGFKDAKVMQGDEDLSALVGGDPEFRRLLGSLSGALARPD